MSTIDMISTAGVTLILAAFVLNTFDMLKEKSKAFFLLNIFGAGLAGWGAYLASFWPFVVLEIVWIMDTRLYVVTATSFRVVNLLN